MVGLCFLVGVLSVVAAGKESTTSTSIGPTTTTASTSVPSPHVPLLTSETFDEFISANPVSLIKFMAPWCGHCKKLAPEYEAAAIQLNKEGGIPLAEVDAAAEGELAQKYGVQGFPTLFLFRDGKSEPYNGGRTADTIVSWVKKMTGPAVSWDSDINEITKEVSGNVYVGRFKSKTSDTAKVFEDMAEQNRVAGTFHAIADKGIKAESVEVHRAGEKEPEVTKDIKDKEGLEEWVKAEAVPLFAPISGENYAAFAARSKNWVWLAADKETYDKHAADFRKASKQFRKEFNFVFLDTENFKQHAEHMLGLTSTPGVAVVMNESKYHFDKSMEDLSAKTLSAFVEKVVAGKVTRFLKSEEVPEKNDDPVKVVVGKQFSEMVFRKSADVFLEVYAPWCGHCKKLSPIWEELAERGGSDSLVIAKMDGTANEPDTPGFDFKGFPTLFFVKAGEKEPIVFEGDRTIEALIEYVNKQGTKTVKWKEAKPKKEEDEESEDKDEL